MLFFQSKKTLALVMLIFFGALLYFITHQPLSQEGISTPDTTARHVAKVEVLEKPSIGTSSKKSEALQKEIHTKQLYKTEYSGNIFFSAPNVATGQKIDISLHGTLQQFQQTLSQNKEVILLMESPNVEVKINNEVSSEFEKEIYNQLTSGIKLLESSEGEILHFQLTRPAESLKMMETLAFMLQIIVPETLPQAADNHYSWQRSEHDYNGEFLSTYVMAKQSKNQLYTIKKQKQLVKSNHISLANTTSVKSDYEFDHNAQWNIKHAFVDTLQVKDWTTHYYNREKMAETQNMLNVKLISHHANLNPKDIARLKEWEKRWKSPIKASDAFLTNENVAKTTKTMLSTEDSEKAAQVAYEKIQSLYQQMLNQTGKELKTTQNKLNRLLKSFIQDHADHLTMLEEDLGHFSQQDPGLRLYLSALSTVSNPEAQNTLLNVLEKRVPDKAVASSIMASLALSKKPDVTAFQRFDQMIGSNTFDSSIIRNAQLSQSAMAQRIDEGGQETIETYIKEQLEKLYSLKSTPDILQQLAVLGNAGNHLRYTDLERYAQHENDTIREQATHAIRFIKDTSAKNDLMEKLATETVLSIKITAANALFYQPITQQDLKSLHLYAEQETNEQLINSLNKVIAKFQS